MQNTAFGRSPDRPIGSSEEDALNRGPFVESLVDALVASEYDEEGALVARRSRGFVVGLTGKWGSGKSRILKLLALRLGSMDRVIVAEFNPWLFNGRDELLAGFFNALREAMGRSKIEQARAIGDKIDQYWTSINFAGHAVAAGIDAMGGSVLAIAGWGWFKPKIKGKGEQRAPNLEREDLEKKLKKAGLAVVVLIDELDRVEDDEVRHVAQLVKAIGDIKGISYLVAYDPARVTEALGKGATPEERMEYGARYLEKIIQHPIPLRPLFTDDVDALLHAAMAEQGIVLGEDSTENERDILSQIKLAVDTPRDIKRLIGSFSALHSLMRGEVSSYDILAYSWLLIKAPSLSDKIANNPDIVVDDPGEHELIERYRLNKLREDGRPPAPVEILGRLAAGHEDLLALIFPRFSRHGDGGPKGMRISRRRNLIRLLYLGNPPGAMPRAEIERVWMSNSITVAELALRELNTTGGLRAFLERLEDFLPLLPSERDTVFWPALSGALTRNEDWIAGPSDGYLGVRDADDLLKALYRSRPENAERVRSIMRDLIARADLVMVPGVLRQHLFAYGMTKHGGPRGGAVVYSKEETEDLLEREAPRYRAAIMAGIALRRLPNVEALYTLANTGRWDDELRSSFTLQLEGPRALATISALLVPPGNGAERDTLNALFDADAVVREFQRLGPFEEGLDPWVADSVIRLRSILEGREDGS